ncbi:T9SS type A sorting domain-containing protein [Marivirga harenae]|uniref:T9SS type A sorting domain-containing protein n=1 Tax=Marivirga harenae TaxID=2010992 RepID=UPI0026E0776B|nr:T9SS type A sorting domain-containing protein [Marivirga harenae]WKV10475.1 T9SS type A sorting domain-containing protein [Marivirga harenae]
MKNILFITLLSTVLLTKAYSQKTSNDNYEGIWTNNSSWQGGTAPNTTGLGPENITIQGYINRGEYPAPTPGTSTALQFATNNEGRDFTVNDTLVVYGDVVFENKAMQLVIGTGGVFIVFGNLVLDNKISINTEGTLIVKGTVSRDQGNTNQADYSGNGNVYATEYTGTSDDIINGGDPNSARTIDQLSDDGFSDLENFVNGDGQTSLPIELKSFTTTKSNKNINLNWVTAKEENFSHFEIERSLDQSNWDPIGMVQGLGESNSDVYYDFTDRNSPFGVVHYRLKAVDIDGSFEYSPVSSIKVGFEGKLAVSPNPVKDVSNLKIQVPTEFREKLAYVGLFDLNGVKIQEFREYNTDGTLQINQKLKSGMYILKVIHNGLQENIRVIIQ